MGNQASRSSSGGDKQQYEAWRKSCHAFQDVSRSVIWNDQDVSWILRTKVGGIIGWGGGTLLGGLRGISEHRRLVPRPPSSEAMKILLRNTITHGITHAGIGAVLGYALPIVLPLSLAAGDLLVTSLVVDRAHASGLTLDMEQRLEQQLSKLGDIQDEIQMRGSRKQIDKKKMSFLRRLETQLFDSKYQVSEWVGGMVTSTTTVLATRRILLNTFKHGTEVHSFGMDACLRSARVPIVGTGFMVMAAFTFGVGRAIFPALLSLNATEKKRVDDFRSTHEGHSFKIRRGESDDDTNK